MASPTAPPVTYQHVSGSVMTDPGALFDLAYTNPAWDRANETRAAVEQWGIEDYRLSAAIREQTVGEAPDGPWAQPTAPAVGDGVWREPEDTIDTDHIAELTRSYAGALASGSMTASNRSFVGVINPAWSRTNSETWSGAHLGHHDYACAAALRQATQGEAPGGEPAPSMQTYHGAVTGFSHDVTGARERYDNLAARDLCARTADQLRDGGLFDPADPSHRALAAEQRLTAPEHLELIAAGEVVARYYRHPADITRAVEAGATWEQIGAARGTTSQQAMDDYQAWADRQHELHVGQPGLEAG